MQVKTACRARVEQVRRSDDDRGKGSNGEEQPVAVGCAGTQGVDRLTSANTRSSQRKWGAGGGGWLRL